MANRICLDCGGIGTGTRCEPCRLARQRVRERTRDRPSAHQRGYTSEYERNRVAVLSLSTVCWLCDKPGADTADHVIPLAAGGTNAPSNLRPAHARCNSSRGAKPHPLTGSNGG